MKKNWIVRKDEDGIPGRLNGTDGDDYFSGGLHGDIYHGRGGSDFIDGNEGGDRLIGDSGSDRIYGEEGKDRLFGGPGRDTLIGGEHKDIITGGRGADMFSFFAWPSYGGVSHLDIITDFKARGLGEFINMEIEPEFGISDFAGLRSIMVQDGDDVVMSFGGVDMLVLEDVRIGQLSADDFFIYVPQPENALVP